MPNAEEMEMEDRSPVHLGQTRHPLRSFPSLMVLVLVRLLWDMDFSLTADNRSFREEKGSFAARCYAEL